MLSNLACGEGAPPPAGPPPPGATTADETLCGEVRLAAARTVSAGKTLAICAGSVVTAASPDVPLTVQGKLLVQGTAGKPVKLAGGGLVIEAGGDLSASYLEIRSARTAIDARPGSAFTIDHLVIEASDAMLVLASNGTIAHGALHGLGEAQSSTPIEVVDASPRITDTVVDKGAFNGVDMIVVGGANAAPVFDHLEVADSHCAF